MSDTKNEAGENALASRIDAREKRNAELPKFREEGKAALKRLMLIAQGNSGQCRHVAAFLLGLYNGSRFPFDLTDLRSIDFEIFDDCMLVLRMDAQPQQEIHNYFPNGSQRFNQMAIDRRIADVQRLKQHARRVIESGLLDYNGDFKNLAHQLDLAMKSEWDSEDL